jgi:dihydrolipoamide dehydrogenase
MPSRSVAVPDIGDFQDVPIIEILVSAGDTVGPEDPLVTLESDKATMDVPAPFGGTVESIEVSIGDRVSEGSPLMTLAGAEADADDGAGAAEQAAGEAASASARQQAPDGTSQAAPDGTGQAAPDDRTGQAAPDDGTGQAAPAAQSTTSASVESEPGAPPADDDGAERDFDVLVLGSGPGGYTAAFRAADLGLRVGLVERHERLGGVCLNVGCIPSKALLHAARVITETEEMAEHGVRFGEPKVDVGALIGWKQSVVDRLTGGLDQLAGQRKVEVIRGEGRFTGAHTLQAGEREVSFASCIIAAGSEAATIPGLPDDPRVIDSTGALSPDSIPGRMLVIGGGIIGLEMACVYDALGTKVTVVEMMDQLIPGADPDLIRPLARRIGERYTDVLLGTRVEAIRAQKNGLQAKFANEQKAKMFDRVLVAVGRVPNGGAIGADAAGVAVDERGFIAVDERMRTNVPHIYAIGDIVGGPMLAHKATHEAKVAAEVIAGRDVTFDALTVPSVAYTDPEVAWMGLTETQAKAEGIDYEKATVPWAASGRALGLGRPEGMTKILTEPEGGHVLGCGIVGVGAGDLISEAVLALEMGATAEDLALTIHPHPTLSETVAFAAEMIDGSITDLLPPRRRGRSGG